jgi:hypothetical protein
MPTLQCPKMSFVLLPTKFSGLLSFSGSVPNLLQTFTGCGTFVGDCPSAKQPDLASGSLYLNFSGHFHWTAVTNMIRPTLQEFRTLPELARLSTVLDIVRRGLFFGGEGLHTHKAMQKEVLPDT